MNAQSRSAKTMTNTQESGSAAMEITTIAERKQDITI